MWLMKSDDVFECHLNIVVKSFENVLEILISLIVLTGLNFNPAAKVHLQKIHRAKKAP